MNKFVYKPPLELKSMKRKALLELLKTRHEKCEGAVMLSDLYESMPQEKADAIVKVNVRVLLLFYLVFYSHWFKAVK